MKLNTVLIALLISFTTFAQNEKGDWNVSLSISPYPTETNGENDFGLIALAGMEFFVSNRVSLGGSFFTSDNTLFKNESNVALKSYGFIPSIQYYFANKSKWNIYGHAGYGFGFDDDKRAGLNGHALRIYSIGPGAHYVLNEDLKLKLFLPYFDARNKTLEVDAVDGVAVFIGVVFNL